MKPFRTSSKRPGVLLPILAGLGLQLACGGGPARRPNVLFIVVDTLRPDHLGCYGRARDTSPAIDALATEAVRFERAYATAPWTSPSVASMITGLYPGSHGLTRIGVRLPDTAVTLAEMLSADGYSTRGVISHSLLGRQFNFQQGYDDYSESEARGLHDHVSTDGVTEQAQQVLREFAAGEQPFLLFLHYFDPHYNYKRHPEYGFAAERVGRLDGTETIQELRELGPALTGEELEFIQDLYDEEIRHTDAGIGRVLETLKELALDGDTIVVLTSDHGEEFMTHGWLGHTRTLYEELVRVPLIMRVPGGEPGVVEELVSLTSLTPTLLELTGVDGDDGKGFQADSLAPLLSSGTAEGTDLVFAEVDFVPINPDNLVKTANKNAVIGERFKIVRDGESGAVEVYDLVTDPTELHNLADERPELVQQLLPILENRIALARGDVLDVEATAISEELLEKLRALGYVGD